MIPRLTFLLVLCLSQLPEFFNNITKTPGSGGTQGGSERVVGGPFENGERMYIGMPASIPSTSYSPGWTQNGQKLLITGTIYKRDGRTPAPGVILYYYHTDVMGVYANREGLDPRVLRHGYIRGWVKSDANGKYSIYTVRPASYPNSVNSAHIHPSIKEPDINNEYYIDEFVFDDDVLLTSANRKRLENRGGSGVLRLLAKGDLHVAEKNIILGLNIPNYPKNDHKRVSTEKPSGLEIGEDQPSFTPFHAYGPDRGSRACPVCKYGRYHGIIYFVGNKPDWTDIRKWLVFLEQESARRGKYLKVYFVYGNDKDYRKDARQSELASLGRELSLTHTALTFVPSFADTESEANLNRINPDVENTLIVYKFKNIIEKHINWKATEENFKSLANTLDKTRTDTFDLPGIGHR